MYRKASGWCQNYFEPYGSENVVIDATGPSSGELRMLRGGGYVHWRRVQSIRTGSHR